MPAGLRPIQVEYAKEVFAQLLKTHSQKDLAHALDVDQSRVSLGKVYGRVGPFLLMRAALLAKRPIEEINERLGLPPGTLPSPLPSLPVGTASVGERIKEARRVAGLSQRGLAKATGLSQAHLSNVEKGKRENPGTDTLQALSHALGVRFMWLVDGTGDPRGDEGEGYAKEVFGEEARRVATPQTFERAKELLIDTLHEVGVLLHGGIRRDPATGMSVRVGPAHIEPARVKDLERLEADILAFFDPPA